MILRLLNPQGIAGLMTSVVLAALLLIQKGEARRWHRQSAQFEQLYRDEQRAFATTIINYGGAAETARALDRATGERVRREQQHISDRTNNDFEARIADARTRAGRLRGQSAVASADPGDRRAASMPGLPAAPGGADQAAAQDRLSLADRLTATEQAIELDELINWVKAQAAVDNNASAVARSAERQSS